MHDPDIDYSDVIHSVNFPQYWPIISNIILFHSIIKAIKHDGRFRNKLINSNDYVIQEYGVGTTTYTKILMICRAYCYYNENMVNNSIPVNLNDFLPNLKGYIIESNEPYYIPSSINCLKLFTPHDIEINLHGECVQHILKLNNSL